MLPRKLSSNENISAKELINFMNANGFAIKEFAQFLGVTDQAIRLWQTDQRKVSITTSKLIRFFEKYPKLIREF